MSTNFKCVECGKCCQGWRIPLALDEAIAWATRGHSVEMLVEGHFYTNADFQKDAEKAYKMARSFPITLGGDAFYIRPVLVGAYNERCPNLMNDNRCAIYHERPMVCRAYPAEINPFIEFKTENKKCPTESWGKNEPAFLSNEGFYPPQYNEVIMAARKAAVQDVQPLRLICESLSISACAIAGEGFAAYSITPDDFIAASEYVPTDNAPRAFRVLSNQQNSIEVLTRCGVACEYVTNKSITQQGSRMVTYIGLKDV